MKRQKMSSRTAKSHDQKSIGYEFNIIMFKLHKSPNCSEPVGL